MRLLTFILKTVFFCTAFILLLSEMMMAGATIVKIPISWNSSSIQSFSVEGAIYPIETKGLPLISILLEESNFSDFEVKNIQKSELSETLSKSIKQKFPFDYKSISLKVLKERGNQVNYLEIFPLQYDSISDKFYKVDYLEVELKTSSKNIVGSNLRTAQSSGNSVLSSGDWYKIPITKTGVYKIDYDYLQRAGINVAAINPKKIRIHGNGGGMLPQIVGDDRPDDIIENAIVVVGEADGNFGKEDYILFYGEGADFHKLTTTGDLEYYKNFYSDTSFYFLTISDQEGLRITEKEDLGDQHDKINSFDDFIIYEKDEYNIINSGREWYGELFDFTLTYDFKFDFSDLIPDTDIVVKSSVMGQTFQEASLDLSINGQALGQQTINTIVDGSYLSKGSNKIEIFSLNTSSIPPSEKFTIRLSFNPVGSKKSKMFLNYLTIIGRRKLKLYEDQTLFRSLSSTQNAISTFEIEGGNTTSQVWEVTDPLKPYKQKNSINGSNITFGAFSSELREFVVFNDNGLLIPEPSIKIQNQNLHASPNVDFLIVTYPGFKSEAERLADFRRNHNGFKVLVVTPNEIYNEFSSGKQDVTAIRDFIKYLYELGTNGSRLQNVLLFGKGSFDYKDRIDNNTNFVPIYTSRNSLHPIASYSSDDYYGFLDDNEGEWRESYAGDLLMDIGVGRLPVKSITEAKVLVDKLINYDTNSEAFGNWRNDIVFIADDGDGNLHLRDANRLATLVDTSYTQFNTNKIYVDAFEQVKTSIGESAPDVNAEIERLINKGALIFNFTGHGSTTRWTSETILNISSASEFKNKNRLPLFVTATCEFGRHDNPKAISGGEYLMLNPNGGAIGLLTTGRPVFSSTNFILNRAFHNNVFLKEEGRFLSIGEVFRRTKNQSLSGSVNRNFSLLADPSMTLSYAKDEILLIADSESYHAGDTLKAFGQVKLKGRVMNRQGQLNTNFNGKLIATVFDQPTEIETYGNENPIMKFLALDNILFKGEVTVAEGEFDIEFIVPKNITYDFEKGKISMYALHESQHLDAGGSNIEFVVGGESEDFEADNTAPQIELFINDTSFVNGGVTRPDVLFVGKISDESGISISNSDLGQELIAILDDGEEITINDYYVSAMDTYKKGWVKYPYQDLPVGIHKIRLKAWDIHNNFNEAEIEFLVVEDENIAIESLMNFPNPFSDYTQFSFEHNRAGDDLEIMIDVFSMQGKLVKQFAYIKENSESRISDLVWDEKEKNGGPLLSGVYVFRLSLRSLNDGSKKQANQKLIIIK